MKKFYFLLMLSVILMFNTITKGQVTDMGGNDFIINVDTILGGKYINIGKFVLNAGKTITVSQSSHFLEIECSVILIEGTIDANGKGEVGGTGGSGGAFANGSGVSGKGGFGGTNGLGTGGGNPGFNGGNGGFITQICGGFLCDGNRDGLNGGGGGAGGGSGGAYGGAGGIGGWGAYGTGFTGASGGTFGNGGLVPAAHGNITDHNIIYGSGGAGAGGGGGGWSYGTAGGAGGAGGGMLSLYATDTITLTISARIYCNGTNGNAGGNGGGESDDNSYDCSTGGYSSCGICSESVYNGAGGAAGGAGGGSGGGIRIKSPGILKLKPGALLQANGGTGGIKGYPNSTVGTCFDDAAAGGGGGGGRIKIITTCNLFNEYDMSYQTFGGTGYATGGSGSFTIIPVYPDTAGPITGPLTVCAGSQSTFSIDIVSNADSYLWTLPTGANIISGANTNSITVLWDTLSSSGSITVVPKSGCGDGLLSMANITVEPLPNYIFNPSVVGDCYQSATSLMATYNPTYTYQWQQDINCNGTWLDIPGADSCVYETGIMFESSCYRLIMTNNCGSNYSNTVNVSVNPIPPTPVIDYLNATTLVSNALSGNQWYNTQGIIPGAINQNYVIPQNDNYYVIVTDSNGCVSLPSNIISFTVGLYAYIASDIQIYPNPSDGLINIEIPPSLNDCIIHIYDIYGRKLSQESVNNTKHLLNLKYLASGIYTITITGKEINYNSRIIINKK